MHVRRNGSWQWVVWLLAVVAVGVGCGDQKSESSSRGVVRDSPTVAPVPATHEVCTPEQPGTPVPTQLRYTGPVEVEFGDELPLSALLTDDSGRALVAREVHFVLGTLEVTALTDDFGLALGSVTPTGPPASLPLTVKYKGDATTAPASASATVVIKRAATVTHFLGPTLLATGEPQRLRASLLDARTRSPIVGRTLVFEAGSLRATGTTDATGIATTSLSWSANATGPAVLRVSFAGDSFHEPSADEAPITRYLPTAFTIWGGNTPGPRLGQRLNFWGHSWAEQVQGGDYASHAEFKGFAPGLRSFALCQPTARTVGVPLLTPECWDSKGGQSSPPAGLPEYIGVLVADSIAKEKGQTYGNVAALAVLRVEPEPVHGPVPGKPGWGTLVAIIDGGAVFPRPAALSATQRQPGHVHPGQGFDVTVEVANTSPTRAEQVTIRERFQGSLPISEEKEVGTLEPDERRTVSFSRTAPVVPPRGEAEPVVAYQTRLAAEDGRPLSSLGLVRFVDPNGSNPPALDLFSSGRLLLPRLSVALSAPPCAGPCALIPYTLTVAHVGQGKAGSATATVTLPDGSQRVFELGALEPRSIVTRTVEWTVSDPGPRGPDESLEAYLQRLQAWSEQNLTVSARVEWTDEGDNTYGPIEQRYTPVPRVAFLAATAERPDTVRPGQSFPLQFTVTNMGKARAWDAKLQLLESGSVSAPFSLDPDQSTTVSMDVAAPPVAPRGEAEPEDAYRARLAAADGRTLSYGYSLDWGTVCGSRLGPIPGSVRTFLVLPVVEVSLAGPAEAQAGEVLSYTVSLRSTGFAEARGLVLSMTLPDGSTREVSLPVEALARGTRIQVPVSHPLPASWTSTELAWATASVRWTDAAGNTYGPLRASTSTKVLRSNMPPLVDAGPDQGVVLPAAATLAGRLVDDGLPEGAELTAAWVQVSGPAVAWFADALKAETSVTFPEPGTYVLRLMGSDSQLTASDELTVTVLPRAGSGATLPGGAPAQRETLVNLVRAGEQIQLEDVARSLGFIWVAVSSKGTIVKIDTETGAVLGEYYSSPHGQPRNPSRTTVDLNGNVWAGNRDGSSVVHIGLVENGQCEDRNGNGIIETSSGLGDVRAWPNWGGADTPGGVSTADDECILHYTRVNSYTIRHVSVDKNNDVWVSGTGYRRFDLIDGRTGKLKRSEPSAGYGGYGGLIDSNGVIWSSNPLLRWDTALPLTGSNGGNWKGYGHNSYGLCIAPDGSVWNSSNRWNQIHRFSAKGELLGSYAHGDYWAQGCTVDRRGHVWVAHSAYRNTVGHLKPDGSLVGLVTVGSGPTGASVDNKGRIWVSNNYGRTVSRINPLKGPKGPDGVTPVGEVELTTVNLGGEVYNYSDMTGSTLTGAPLSGLWTVVHDSGQVGSEWGRVAWTAQVCGNGSLKVTVASSEDGVLFGNPEEVRGGEDFTVPNGRYLRVNTAFRRSNKGESPVIYGMTMGTARYEMPSQVNAAPNVHAGRERVVTEANPLRLTGSACDDGLPGGGPLAMQWSQVSGPGTATFSAPGEEVTDVTFSAPGTYVLRLAASDSALEAHSDVTVTVVKGNFPPEVVVDSPKSVGTAPGSVLLTAQVSDDGLPAGSTVSVGWTLVSGPGTVSFDKAGTVPTTATFNKAGTYVVRLTASDGQLSRGADVLVQVGGAASPNKPPQVSAGPGRNLTLPTRAVTLKGSVTDDGMPAGKPLNLTWSQVSGPPGVTFASPKQAETGVTLPALGAYVLRLTASDSQLVGSADVRVMVEVAPPENQVPVVSAGVGQTVALPPGRAVLDGRVLDDGQPEGAGLRVAWSAVDGPGPVTFAEASQAGTEARFSTPGDYTLRLWASDSERSASSAVRVAVRANLVNAPPVVGAVAPPVVNLPSPALLSGSVRDEGLPVTGSLTVAWSQVGGPGTVSFSPPDRVASRAYFSEPGEYVLRLTASDSELTASMDVTVRVLENNAPPTVFAGADQVLEYPLRTATLTGTASDDGLPRGGSLSVAWSVVQGPGAVSFSNPSEMETSVAFSYAGTYVLRLTASDTQKTASAEVSVEVKAPAGELPTVALRGPEEGAEVRSPVSVVGSISGGEWQLEFRPGSDEGSRQPWKTLASGYGAVSGGELGTFDPTLLLNGIYTLRLTSTTESGAAATTSTVVATRNMKMGHFSLSFTDLNVPVAGLPIELVRTYDSRDLRSGDFGVGWSLDLRNVRVEKSGVLGRHWAVVLAGSVWFVPRYCLQPTKPSFVTITFPTGKVYRFRTGTEPACSYLIPPRWANVVFNPEPGTNGSLVVSGASSVTVDGSIGPVVLRGADRSRFNPSRFQLTIEDGTVYELDEHLDVLRVADTNSNTLVFNEMGVVHSSGKSVLFERDAMGRITRITDPNGDMMTYAYDARGDLWSFTDREGNTTVFEYNTAHQLLTIKDPRGIQPVRNEYDEQGRLVRRIDAFGKIVKYTYSIVTRQKIVTDRLGYVRVHEYDEDGNLVRETDPAGLVTTRTYDALGYMRSETDPAGNTKLYTYDSLGNLKSKTDALGRKQNATYGKFNRPLSMSDPLGQRFSNSYDVFGNLRSTTDAAGNVTEFTYNLRGLQESKMDSLGCTSHYFYDDFGNLTRQTDPLGNVTTYAYDANGRLVADTKSRTTPKGNETLVTRHEYDRLGRKVATTHPDGSVVRVSYDALDNETSRVDPLGRAMRFNYDDAGRRIRTTYPDGTFEEASHDVEGRMLTSTDKGGETTRYAYDHNGRLVLTTHSDGTMSRKTYDTAGRESSSTDERGNITRYEYDATGQFIRTINALGKVRGYNYNERNQLVAETDFMGRTLLHEYDPLGHRTRTTFPDGSSIRTEYDALGRVTARVDQEGRGVRFEYDCLGRLLSVTDALNQMTMYDYDEQGNLVSQMDAKGRVTSFEYDNMGREVRRILPLGKSESREYDAIGNIIRLTKFSGQSAMYTYDSMDRLVERRYSDGRITRLAYTALGKRSSVMDENGTTRYAYDVRGRIINLIYPDGRSLTYGYDEVGNRTQLTAQIGGESRTTSYAFDALNRPVRVIDEAGRFYELSYDTNGSRTSLLYPNGVATTYNYDTQDRITALDSRRSDGALVQSYKLTLSPAGHRTHIEEGNGAALTYSYDPLYRLTKEVRSGDPTLSYERSFQYDQVGNRLDYKAVSDDGTIVRSSVFDDRDRLLSDGVSNYLWDEDGRLVEKTGPDGARYVWDFNDRLRQVILADGTGIEHGYDVDGNRLWTRVTKADGEIRVTNYLVDTSGWLSHVVAESDASEAWVAHYARLGDELLSVSRVGQVRFFHQDAIGSTRMLTDQLGNASDEYTYSAFGELLRHTGMDQNQYLFAAEILDTHSGLYNNRARWMHPETGRFVSVDPFSGDISDPASLHRYSYVNSNPVNLKDPTGLMWWVGLVIAISSISHVFMIYYFSGAWDGFVKLFSEAWSVLFDTFKRI